MLAIDFRNERGAGRQRRVYKQENGAFFAELHVLAYFIDELAHRNVIGHQELFLVN